MHVLLSPVTISTATCLTEGQNPNKWYRVFLEEFHEKVGTWEDTSRVHRNPQLQCLHNITLHVLQCALTVQNSHVLTRALAQTRKICSWTQAKFTTVSIFPLFHTSVKPGLSH